MTKKTEMEQWVDIGDHVKQFKQDYFELCDKLSTVPKTVKGRHLRRIEDSITNLKSDLEERMFYEQSEGWLDNEEDNMSSVFYGTNGKKKKRNGETNTEFTWAINHQRNQQETDDVGLTNTKIGLYKSGLNKLKSISETLPDYVSIGYNTNDKTVAIKPTTDKTNGFKLSQKNSATVMYTGTPNIVEKIRSSFGIKDDSIIRGGTYKQGDILVFPVGMYLEDN